MKFRIALVMVFAFSIGALWLQAFHTFPDDCVIVKSQSVFRLPV